MIFFYSCVWMEAFGFLPGGLIKRSRQNYLRQRFSCLHCSNKMLQRSIHISSQQVKTHFRNLTCAVGPNPKMHAKCIQCAPVNLPKVGQIFDMTKSSGKKQTLRLHNRSGLPSFYSVENSFFTHVGFVLMEVELGM